jgi:hypothetical protein
VLGQKNAWNSVEAVFLTAVHVPLAHLPLVPGSLFLMRLCVGPASCSSSTHVRLSVALAGSLDSPAIFLHSIL